MDMKPTHAMPGRQKALPDRRHVVADRLDVLCYVVIVALYPTSETGGIMISPLATDKDQKPGAAMRPYYGVDPVILDSQVRG